jgi:alkyl sulfatase BDS1-like metallo-beta-lactamase superfamily hydrolase
VLELSNAALTNIEGYQAEDADLTVTVNRSDLNLFIMGVAKFSDLVKEGKAKLEGNPQVFAQLQGMMVKFDPRFEILPGTK